MTTKTETTIKIELTDINKITPYPNNAKKHSDAQVKVLANLIKTKGWTTAITVDVDGEIILGHGRRLAAIHLGLKRVPVIWRRDLTKLEAAAMRLADNRVVSTDYDTMLEQSELLMLEEGGYAIEELPYTADELAFLATDLSEMDEGAFVGDVSEAVETQKAENEEKAGEVDKSAAAIGDAFGFKRVTIEQSRTIRSFMSGLESKTGKTGIDAFMDFIGSAS